MYSSLAIQNEEKQYFNINGQIKEDCDETEIVRVGGKYRLPILQKVECEECEEEECEEEVKKPAVDPSPIYMI
jgi:hypothetical protein